jgi:hypothetical protein
LLPLICGPLSPPKNTLIGFCDLTLAPSGLILHDCTLHSRPDGKRWVGLPARPQIDSVTRLHRKDATTGKFLWAPSVEIYGQAERQRFQKAALAAIDALIERGPQ